MLPLARPSVDVSLHWKCDPCPEHGGLHVPAMAATFDSFLLWSVARHIACRLCSKDVGLSLNITMRFIHVYLVLYLRYFAQL